MSLPADAPLGTVSCGDLRREPDSMGARWYFGRIYLGRDGEPYPIVAELDDRVGFVAAKLARALEQACDELERCGDVSAANRGWDTIRRFEHWKQGHAWR